MMNLKKTFRNLLALGALAYFGTQEVQSQSNHYENPKFYGTINMPKDKNLKLMNENFVDIDKDGDLDVLATYKDTQTNNIIAQTYENIANYQKNAYNHYENPKYYGTINMPKDKNLELTNINFVDIDKDGDLDVLATYKDTQTNNIIAQTYENITRYSQKKKTRDLTLGDYIIMYTISKQKF